MAGSEEADGNGEDCAVNTLNCSASAVLELGKQLLQAAREGDTSSVLALMTRGAPFTTDWLGTSPLHLAAMNAHEETCSVLLRAGINRDTRTKVERTPLHVAAYEGHVRVVRLLLAHGADPHARDMLHMTPLHWAAERGHADCARALLAAGADPHAPSKFCRTPLTLAATDRNLRALMLRASVATHTNTREIKDECEDTSVAEQERTELHEPTEDGASVLADTTTPLMHTSSTQQEESATDTVEGEEKSEAGEAAALLRQHGITLLPTDTSNTLLSALRSGRTVVLSDAGKLLLKESAPAPPPPPAAQVSPQAAHVSPPTRPASHSKLATIVTVNGKQIVRLGGVGGGAPLGRLVNTARAQLKTDADGGAVLRLQRVRAAGAAAAVTHCACGGAEMMWRLRAELVRARATIAQREQELAALRAELRSSNTQ